jgi:hypothetical protein
MTVDTIVLQRRQAGPHADELLDRLQDAVPAGDRAGWDDSGHARLPAHGDIDRGREAVRTRLAQLADDWDQYVGIL